MITFLGIIHQNIIIQPSNICDGREYRCPSDCLVNKCIWKDKNIVISNFLIYFSLLFFGVFFPDVSTCIFFEIYLTDRSIVTSFILCKIYHTHFYTNTLYSNTFIFLHLQYHTIFTVLFFNINTLFFVLIIQEICDHVFSCGLQFSV